VECNWDNWRRWKKWQNPGRGLKSDFKYIGQKSNLTCLFILSRAAEWRLLGMVESSNQTKIEKRSFTSNTYNKIQHNPPVGRDKGEYGILVQVIDAKFFLGLTVYYCTIWEKRWNLFSGCVIMKLIVQCPKWHVVWHVENVALFLTKTLTYKNYIPYVVKLRWLLNLPHRVQL